MRRIFQGLVASPGIAIGPAWLYRPVKAVLTQRSISNPRAEWSRLKNALADARQQLQELYDSTLCTLGAEEADIFGAQSLFLEDPDLLDKTRQIIENKSD